jgi:hypothetical protein
MDKAVLARMNDEEDRHRILLEFNALVLDLVGLWDPRGAKGSPFARSTPTH